MNTGGMAMDASRIFELNRDITEHCKKNAYSFWSSAARAAH